MLKPKFTAFNLAQLVITIAAVMFGVYGVIHSGDAPANAPVVADALDGAGPFERDSGRSPLELRDPKPQPRPIGPDVDFTPEPVVFDPKDSGNGVLKGSTTFSDGRAIENMKVTAISTQSEVTAPDWDEQNLARTRAEYDRYFRELQRNTRVTYSDYNGRFEFDGLDSSHSYRVSVNDPEIGTDQQVVQPGSHLTFQFDVPVILEGVVTASNGTLPRDWWVTVNVETSEGWFEYVHSAAFHSADGKFRIRAKTGKVQVVVNATGWIQDSVPVLEVGTEGASCEVTLLKAAALSGTVRSIDGSPLPSATVTVLGQNGSATSGYWDGREEASSFDSQRALILLSESINYIKSSKEMDEFGEIEYWGGMAGYTDQAGKYRIDGLRPGTFTVTATVGSFVESREIVIASGENFADFSIDAGNRIRISARDSNGKPVTPSYAWFADKQGQYAECVQISARDGVLEYMGIKDGTWTMTVQAEGYPQTAREVIVRTGVNEVEILFQEPGTLSGRVAAGSSTMPQNLYVRLTLDTGDKNAEKRRRNWNNGGGQYYAIDAEGNYKAENLQPGDYQLSVEFNQNDRLYEQELSISVGEQVQDIVLDQRSSLTVTVDLAPELKNKEGISIAVSQTGGKSRNVNRYAALDANNRAEFSFLPEGDYSVVAYSQDGTQSNVTTTVNRGGNSVTLSLGPPNCVKITQVAEGYQAVDVGIQVGDLIIEYNGTIIQNMEELVAQVQATTESDSITMVVVRGGSTLTFRLNGGRIGINGDNFRR